MGPREQLEKFGIPVLKDLPVGENLQDHVGMGGLTFLVNKPVSIVQDRFMAFPMGMQYFVHSKGPMTTLGGVEGKKCLAKRPFLYLKICLSVVVCHGFEINLAPSDPT